MPIIFCVAVANAFAGRSAVAVSAAAAALCRKPRRSIFTVVHQNCSLDLLTEVGTQCERAVIVQLLMTSPPHGIAHSLYLNLSSKLQSFPIYDVGKHELCLSNLAR